MSLLNKDVPHVYDSDGIRTVSWTDKEGVKVKEIRIPTQIIKEKEETLVTNVAQKRLWWHPAMDQNLGTDRL